MPSYEDMQRPLTPEERERWEKFQKDLAIPQKENWFSEAMKKLVEEKFTPPTQGKVEGGGQ